MGELFYPKPVSFEEVDHTADWAYQIEGSSLEDLFIQSAQGLYYLAGTQLASAPSVEKEIHLKGIDLESLLVAWLNELLYLRESENIGFSQFKISRLSTEDLQAKLVGYPIQQWLKDIKAVTYNNLSIRSTQTGFTVTLVLDV